MVIYLIPDCAYNWFLIWYMRLFGKIAQQFGCGFRCQVSNWDHYTLNAIRGGDKTRSSEAKVIY